MPKSSPLPTSTVWRWSSPAGGTSVTRPAPDDAAALLGYLGNPVVIEHTSYPVQDAVSVEAFIEIFRRGYVERSSCRWAVVRASDDALIGTCGFNDWAPEHASTELAYDLAPDDWGQGLMRQAVGAALEWAFDTAGFNRVQAVVMVSSPATSRRRTA